MTAIDTNVLLDILIPGAPDAQRSTGLFEACQAEGAVIISEVVFTELSSRFPGPGAFDNFLSEARVQLVRSDPSAFQRAGAAWVRYARNRRKSDVLCHACGSKQMARCAKCSAAIPVRQHIIADFMIGGHAIVHADRLLTRDRGYYSAYFEKLRLVGPS